MRPSVRRAAIVERIDGSHRATVEELADEFGASLETVRRDLNVLAEAGRLRKIHGGAVKLEMVREGTFGERLKKNLRAKQEVAEKVAGLVRPGQSLMIDTGTATLICAEALSRVRDLTVVTNSTRIADRFARAQNGANVFLLGGKYHADSAQTTGPQTCFEIRRFRTDHVILTASAIDLSGVYDFTEEEAQVARAMAQNIGNLTLVADSSKLGRSSVFKICDLENVRRIVLEEKPDLELKSPLIDAGAEII